MLASERFLNINKVFHTFPEELQNIGFSITLLHKHKHAPSSSVLVFFKNFTCSEYLGLDKIDQYYPCSWYLNNDKIEPYEFCDEKLPYFEKNIRSNYKFCN